MNTFIYAIRRKSDGFWLPARKNTARGFSHDEPEEDGGKHGPRLFVTGHGARSALRAWGRGKYEPKWTSGDSHFAGFGGPEYVGNDIKPAPGRDLANMEVVMFKLEEIDSATLTK